MKSPKLARLVVMNAVVGGEFGGLEFVIDKLDRGGVPAALNCLCCTTHGTVPAAAKFYKTILPSA